MKSIMVLKSNEEWLRTLREQNTVAGEQALQELYEYLLRSVLLYLSLHREELADWNRQMVRDLAEDIAQDALLDVLGNLESFRGESKFTTWVYRFAINRAATELRRRRYRNLSLDRLLEEADHAFDFLFERRQRDSLERQLERQSYIQLLYALVTEELTERQRIAIIGIYLHGYSMAEVAAILETNHNALYKLLHDARQRLKSALQERHLTHSDILAAFEE
jgi:RNA polymerase sigma-70 factor (ECF subfamily)